MAKAAIDKLATQEPSDLDPVLEPCPSPAVAKNMRYCMFESEDVGRDIGYILDVAISHSWHLYYLHCVYME